MEILLVHDAPPLKLSTRASCRPRTDEHTTKSLRRQSTQITPQVYDVEQRNNLHVYMHEQQLLCLLFSGSVMT